MRPVLRTPVMCMTLLVLCVPVFVCADDVSGYAIPNAPLMAIVSKRSACEVEYMQDIRHPLWIYHVVYIR